MTNAMLGHRSGLRVTCYHGNRFLLVKFYGPDLPEKYTTKEGGPIARIDWEQFKREVLDKTDKESESESVEEDL